MSGDKLDKLLFCLGAGEGRLHTGLRGLLSCLSSVLILRIRKGIYLQLENIVHFRLGRVAKPGARRLLDGQQRRPSNICTQTKQ
jgi:hypothetical protein